MTISRSSTVLTINRVSKLSNIVEKSVSSWKGTTLRNIKVLFSKYKYSYKISSSRNFSTCSAPISYFDLHGDGIKIYELI